MSVLNCRPLLVLQGVLLVLMGNAIFAQEAKHRARVSVDYMKVMPATSLLNITAKYRGEEGFEPAQNLAFEILDSRFPDSLLSLGNSRTDFEGIARYDLSHYLSTITDTTGAYHFLVRSLENPDFDFVEKEIIFREAVLTTQLISEGELPALKATLTDKFNGDPLEGFPLKVQVQRLFRPLRIGDEVNVTDADGTILVPIDQGIPGINGTLRLEVVLSDDEQYGNIKAGVEAPVGSVIEDLSTFDERTMWGPPDKTPLFLLIIPNLLILGVWGAVLILILNLIKIYKSKN